MKKTFSDSQAKVVKGLYFAHFTPLEAKSYIDEHYQELSLPVTVISRLYSYFKAASVPRYDKASLIPDPLS